MAPKKEVNFLFGVFLYKLFAKIHTLLAISNTLYKRIYKDKGIIYFINVL